MKNSRSGVSWLNIVRSTKLNDSYTRINNISVYNHTYVKDFGSLKFLTLNQQGGFQKQCYHEF